MDKQTPIGLLDSLNGLEDHILSAVGPIGKTQVAWSGGTGDNRIRLMQGNIRPNQDVGGDTGSSKTMGGTKNDIG